MALNISLPSSNISFDTVPSRRTKYKRLRIRIFNESASVHYTGRVVIERVAGCDPRFKVVTTPEWLGNEAHAEKVISVAPRSTLDVFAFVSYRDPNGASGQIDCDLNVLTNPNQANMVTARASAQTGSFLKRRIQLLLDCSLSMNTQVGGVARIVRLKNTVNRCIELLASNDCIGVSTFGGGAGTLPNVPMADLGPPAGSPQRTALANLLNSLVAGPANVSIDGAITATQTALGSATDVVILVLTAGVESGNLLPVATAWPNTFALGIDVEAGAPRTAVTRIPTGSNGYALFVKASVLHPDDRRLNKFMSLLLFDTLGSAVLLDPDGVVLPGKHDDYEFFVNETDLETDVLLFANNPRVIVSLPQEFLPQESSKRTDGLQILKIRPLKPELLQKTGGRLIARVARRPDDPDPKHKQADSSCPPEQGDGSYTLLVAAESELSLAAHLHATSSRVGARLLISALLTEFGQPVSGRVEVRAELTYPDGSVSSVELKENRRRAEGHFRARVRTYQPGAYTVHFIATGCTLTMGLPFRREAVRMLVLEREPTEKQPELSELLQTSKALLRKLSQ
jgi:hypothetical protein